jgi:hypothetical protein
MKSAMPSPISDMPSLPVGYTRNARRNAAAGRRNARVTDIIRSLLGDAKHM